MNKQTPEQCAKAISNFVRAYRASHDRTPRDLYQDTGYSNQHSQITQEMIEDVIRKDELLVREWFLFSQDKRWTPAWALSDDGDGKWSVSYVAENGKQHFVSLFTDQTRACALMVRMEMEDFRKKEANQAIQPIGNPRRVSSG